MLLNQDIALLFSLFSLGFFGGFSHCIGMCGPFVLTQVDNRLVNIKIDDASEFKKMSGLILMPYHLGRITTYSLIGAALSLMSFYFKQHLAFKIISGTMLLIAALIFANLAIAKIKLPFKLNKIIYFNVSINKISFLNKLFLNPTGWNGYLLGVLLGFIPCGLLYGAFLMVVTMDNFLIAALAMFIFGISTIPALFATAYGSYWFLDKFKNKFNFVTKIILLINSLTLFLMAIGLIFNKI